MNEDKHDSTNKNRTITEGKFVPFKLLREDWNKYRISDKSLLKARVILASCIMKKNLEQTVRELKPSEKLDIGLVFHPRTMFVIESPPELRGNPDFKSYSTDELSESIIDEDMDFETAKEVWNSYELENGISLKFRLSVITINKTNKFEKGGMPIYTVNSNIDVKSELPKRIQVILKKKGKKKVKATVKLLK